MAKGKTARLRIYCICGQKMKVSATMYGRPGKCVACRQKIRIPTLDEIPPESKEIHLKDHPEFLRKPAVRPESLKDEPAEAELEVIPLGGEDRKEPSAPMEVFEPLRILCSLETKIERQLKAMGEPPRDGTRDKRRAEAEGYRIRVRRARAELDESLRQRLMEAAIELATVQQRLGDMNLSVRVGEMEFAAYREAADKARRRRDQLEKRQLNLRGWLAVRSTKEAGGYTDVPLDRIPEETEVRFPKMPELSGSLLEEHVLALRGALERRERAERKLSATERMQGADSEAPARLREMREACEAELREGQSGVTFWSGRLDQLLADYLNDLQVIDSQMDLIRGRMQLGDIDRAQYEHTESELVQAKTDLSKAVSLARRALTAPSAADLPQTRGTFIQRLGAHPSPWLVPEAFLAWGASVLLLASLFLPVLDGVSPLGLSPRHNGGQWTNALWSLSPIAFAVMAAVVGILRDRTVRGLCLCGLALAGAVALAVYAAASRSGGEFPIGVVLWWLAEVALLAAAFVSLWPSRRLRVAPFAVTALALLVCAGGALAAYVPRWLNDLRSMAAAPAPSAPVRQATPAHSQVPVAPLPVLAPSPPADADKPPVPSETAPPRDETGPPKGGDPLGLMTVEAELGGVLSSPGRAPRFSITVHTPGNAPHTDMVGVGEPIYGEWTLAEYNPVTQAVTLSKGNRLLVIRKGERIALETVQ